MTSDKVVLDDLLVSRPGGVVRLQPGSYAGEGHVMPLISPDVAVKRHSPCCNISTVWEIRTGVMSMGAVCSPTPLTSSTPRQLVHP